LPIALIEAGSKRIGRSGYQQWSNKRINQRHRTGLLVKPSDRKAFKAALDRLIEDKSYDKRNGKEFV